jgi:hypothetical protein
MPTEHVAFVVGLILAAVIVVPLQRWLRGGQPEPIEPPEWCTSAGREHPPITALEAAIGWTPTDEAELHAWLEGETSG